MTRGLDYYTARIRASGLEIGSRVTTGNGHHGTVLRLGSWVEGVCIRLDATGLPFWNPYDATIRLDCCVIQRWQCRTCTRVGSGDAPRACPECASERDPNHGPHPMERASAQEGSNHVR